MGVQCNNLCMVPYSFYTSDYSFLKLYCRVKFVLNMAFTFLQFVDGPDSPATKSDYITRHEIFEI